MFRKQPGNWCRRIKNQTESDERKNSNSTSSRNLAASSPELKNMEYTHHQCMSKIFQFLRKKLGMSGTKATFSMEAYKTNVLTLGVFMSSSMKAAIHLGPNYVSNSEIYKNTKFEEIENLFNIAQKLVMEHSEEILSVKCLEYSSPSGARSVLANDQAIKWAKAKVCVHADSVLCVGQMKETPGAIERCKGQVEGLKMYSSCQDAVGIEERSIEFE